MGAIVGDRHSGAVNSSFNNCQYNKVDGLYGIEGTDESWTTPVTGLTRDASNKIHESKCNN